jgi:hypothetical protein
MKKPLAILGTLSLNLFLAFPAFAISPFVDLNTPTQIKATFQEQQGLAKAADEQNPNQTTNRDQDVKAIQNLLKADELDRQNNMRAALRQENLEDKTLGNKDLELALAEKNVDLHLGKVLTDMHGDRVRMEEYVLRPAGNQVEFLNLTMRDKRLDYITYTATFNGLVPANTNGLWHKDFGSTKPSIYLTDETEVFSNMNDAVVLNTNYFNPTLDGITQHYLLPIRQSSLTVDQILKWGMERSLPTDTFSEMPNDVGASGFKQDFINNNFLAKRTTWTWKDGTQTTLDTYLIDEKGNLRTLDPSNVNDWANWTQNFSDLAFNSYTEVIWNSSEFQGRTIDNVSQFLTLTTFFSDPLDKNP